jgi:hypothetical protein
MPSRSRIRVPTKKTRSWRIKVAVNAVETCRRLHVVHMGGKGRGPEFAAKRKPGHHVPPPVPGSFLRGYRTAITQSDAAYPTLFRQFRCQGVCDQGWWCPFYGRFSTKKSASWTAKAAALSLSRLSPTRTRLPNRLSSMNTENPNGESAPPAINSFSSARSAASPLKNQDIDPNGRTTTGSAVSEDAKAGIAGRFGWD